MTKSLTPDGRPGGSGTWIGDGGAELGVVGAVEIGEVGDVAAG
jgi:hypothetical protein